MTASMKLNTDNYTQHKYFYYAFQFKRVKPITCLWGLEYSTQASDNIQSSNLGLV